MKASNKFARNKFNANPVNNKDAKNIEHSFATMQTRKNINLEFLATDKIRNLNKIPEKNEILFVMTTSNINSCELLEIINEKHKIKKAYASYNVINKTGYNELKKYPFQTIIMSDKYLHTEKQNNEIANHVKKLPNHTKIFLFECENDNYISVNSSTNPSTSSANESYIIYNSKEKYDFYLNFFEEQTTNKQKITIPEKSESTSYLNINKIGVKDLFTNIAKKETIKELSFIQFTDGLKALNIIENYPIDKINFYLSNRMPSMNRVTFKKAKDLTKGDFFFKKSTHCKMTLIQTTDNYYTIVSTSNWFSNTKYELHEIFNNKELHNNLLNFARNYFK